MGDAPNYYQILGVEPAADMAAIESAYHGRMLRFRVGRFGGRAHELSGPTQAELERAYAVLSSPAERALYDAEYFPEALPQRLENARSDSRRRRRRIALGLLTVLLVALGVVAVVGSRPGNGARVGDDGSDGAIVTATVVPAAQATGGAGDGVGQSASPVLTPTPALAAVATVTPTLRPEMTQPAPVTTVRPMVPSPAAPAPTATASSPTATAANPTAPAPAVASTGPAATVPPVAASGPPVAAPPGPTATTAMTATPTPTLSPTSAPTPEPTPAPSPETAPEPVAEAPVVEPTPELVAEAPVAEPTPEPVIVIVTPEPAPPPSLPLPPPPPSAPPPPAPTPAFRATDRIGTVLSVNLRTGPGAGFPSQGLLPTGTPLAATGESARVRGVLWRRFVLPDGRNGWVRDLDTLPVRR